MTNEVKKTNDKFFSIHCINALKNMDYSIIIGNIDNTEEKRNLALKLFPLQKYHYELHNCKKNMNIVIQNY
jgi:hypothetical protein